jgi:hypothetical protein
VKKDAEGAAQMSRRKRPVVVFVPQCSLEIKHMHLGEHAEGVLRGCILDFLEGILDCATRRIRDMPEEEILEVKIKHNDLAHDYTYAVWKGKTNMWILGVIEGRVYSTLQDKGARAKQENLVRQKLQAAVLERKRNIAEKQDG